MSGDHTVNQMIINISYDNLMNVLYYKGGIVEDVKILVDTIKTANYLGHMKTLEIAIEDLTYKLETTNLFQKYDINPPRKYIKKLS